MPAMNFESAQSSNSGSRCSANPQALLHPSATWKLLCSATHQMTKLMRDALCNIPAAVHNIQLVQAANYGAAHFECSILDS
jgi:hypothetical protein